MTVLGFEEIFLKVKDMEKMIGFYQGIPCITLKKGTKKEHTFRINKVFSYYKSKNIVGVFKRMRG